MTSLTLEELRVLVTLSRRYICPKCAGDYSYYELDELNSFGSPCDSSLTARGRHSYCSRWVGNDGPVAQAAISYLNSIGAKSL